MKFKRGDKVISFSYGLGEIEIDFWITSPNSKKRWGVYFYNQSEDDNFQYFSEEGYRSEDGPNFEKDIYHYDKKAFKKVIEEMERTNEI